MSMLSLSRHHCAYLSCHEKEIHVVKIHLIWFLLMVRRRYLLCPHWRAAELRLPISEHSLVVSDNTYGKIKVLQRVQKWMAKIDGVGRGWLFMSRLTTN